MAWQRWRQAMAKWRWGRRKWRGPGLGPDQRHILRPQRHLAMAWRRRRQAMGTPSNWERPVTGNAITLNGNAITLNGNARVWWGWVGWGGGGWGGVVVVGGETK